MSDSQFTDRRLAPLCGLATIQISNAMITYLEPNQNLQCAAFFALAREV